MNITCAILHNSKEVTEKLEKFIAQTPFLTLCGKYKYLVEALSAYYEHYIQLFFIGIENEGGMEGHQFCQFLNPPTRVIFISTTKELAADCFRLDALDYLLTTFTYPIFLEAANKALRWFNISQPESSIIPEIPNEETFIYIKSEYRIIRLELDEIDYIEGLGDYIKIYCRHESKPILSLCRMKSLEQLLPEKDFMRVHRSYIVRKRCIRVLERGNIIIGKISIPVGDSYRKRFQEYINRLPIL